MPGIDLVLPDFTYLRENADRVEAAFLTHAHEDHAGGLAFLLRDISFPVYGSPLSLGLARNRIEEAGHARAHRAHPRARRRAPHDRPVRLRVHPRHALGAARVRHRVPHARGHDPAQRRLQARPHAGRRPQDRPLAHGRDRQALGRREAAALRLHQRLSPRVHAVGVDRRRHAAVGVPRLPRPAADRRQLRVAPPPRAPGRRAGRRRRAQGRVPRPLDGQQRRARPRDGHARHPGRAASSTSTRCRATRRARCASSAPGRRASR